MDPKISRTALYIRLRISIVVCVDYKFFIYVGHTRKKLIYIIYRHTRTIAVASRESRACKTDIVVFTCGRPPLLRMIRIYDVAPAYRGTDALKFRFQCLSRSLFHIDTAAIVSAPSASPYTSPRRLHHRVCGRTSFVIRADFSPIAPVLRPEKEREPRPGKGDRRRRRLHLHGLVACCTGRPGGVAWRGDSVRSLSASYYYSTTGAGHTLAARLSRTAIRPG